MSEARAKVAIVTGAGQGIGREIAITLAKHGTSVVVADITERIFEVADEIKSLGFKALPVECDVTNKKDVDNMVRRAIEEFGTVDILVNNAGIYPKKPFLEMTEEEWDKVLDVNLKGVFYCTKAVLPRMIEQKYGKIVNLSSIAGSVVGFPNLAHYSASKAGIVGLTRTIALEVATYGINVNAVAPGPVETPGTKALREDMYEQTKAAIPLGRWGYSTDIANLVLFLASDQSSFITGQCITIDGGYTLQ